MFWVPSVMFLRVIRGGDVQGRAVPVRACDI